MPIPTPRPTAPTPMNASPGAIDPGSAVAGPPGGTSAVDEGAAVAVAPLGPGVAVGTGVAVGAGRVAVAVALAGGAGPCSASFFVSSSRSCFALATAVVHGSGAPFGTTSAASLSYTAFAAARSPSFRIDRAR